jgi:hypothetical protein
MTSRKRLGLLFFLLIIIRKGDKLLFLRLLFVALASRHGQLGL